MADVKIKNIDQSELLRFDQFCKKKGTDRTNMIREFIKNFGEFETVIDAELRMKAILDEVLEHLDLNTQAYLMNVKLGLLPVAEQTFQIRSDEDEAIHDPAE